MGKSTDHSTQRIEGARLSEESAQRIAQTIKAEILADTQYFVVLVPRGGPIAFLAEFPPDNVARIFRDVAADIEAQNREVDVFDVKDH